MTLTPYGANERRRAHCRVIDIRGVKPFTRGGRRSEYALVGVAAGEQVEGDAAALARVYVYGLAFGELYVADLDAIEGGTNPTNSGLLGQISALGAPVWVDAGVTTPAAANAVLEAGASAVIVGLETLTSIEALGEISQAIGGERVAFSVDLRTACRSRCPARRAFPMVGSRDRQERRRGRRRDHHRARPGPRGSGRGPESN